MPASTLACSSNRVNAWKRSGRRVSRLTVTRCNPARRRSSARSASRPHHSDLRKELGSGGAFSTRRWDDLRRDRLDDGPFLRLLRPEPPDRRRPLVSLSVREERSGSARTAAGRGAARGAAPADRVVLARARGPGRRGAARDAKPRAAGPHRLLAPRPASGNAYKGGIGVSLSCRLSAFRCLLSSVSCP